MFSWLGTLFILTVIFYAFYIPLKKLYYALSPKKRAIHKAEEEWGMLLDIEDRKRKEMFDLDEQRSKYFDQWSDLNREDFDTEEAYQAEKERLELKYTSNFVISLTKDFTLSIEFNEILTVFIMPS